MIKLTIKILPSPVPRRRNIQYAGQHTVRFWEHSRWGASPSGLAFAGANIWVTNLLLQLTERRLGQVAGFLTRR